MTDEFVVLLVTPDPAFREQAQTALSGDATVVSVESASAATDTLADRAVDCVVTDHAPPDFDGLGFLRGLREEHPDLPLVICPADGSESLASRATAAGADDYLPRPAPNEGFDRLAERVRSLAAAHREHRQRRRGFQAVEAADEGIALLDDEGRFVYANKAYTDVLGYGDDDLSGNHWSMLYPDETVDEYREEIVPRVREEGRWSGETVMVRADGERVLTSHSLIRTDDAFVCVVEDVTDRRERSRALAEERAFLGSVLDSLDDVFFVVDREEKIRRWNEGLREFTGLDADALDGLHPSEFVVADDHDGLATALRTAFEGGTAKLRTDLSGADGPTAYELRVSPLTNDDGDVTGACCVARDVSVQLAVERELERSEEALAELYRVSSHLGLDFEEKVEQILELGAERLDLPYAFLTRIEGGTQYIETARGDHHLLQPGESCPLDRAYCRKTIEVGGLLGVQEASEEGWAGDPAHETFDLESYLGGKVTVDGELFGTLCFAGPTARERPFSDSERTFVELLTRWVSYELGERRSRRELERQNERLQQFASVLSHDLRNPLAVAQGHVDLLSEDLDDDRLDTVEDALDRMERLITGLLSLARDGDTVSDTEPVDLDDVSEEAWEFVTAPNATLTVAGDLRFEADRDRLLQVFENLFRNAVEHATRDSADDETEPPGVSVTVGPLDDQGFYVEDDGPGIAVENRETVLETGVSGSEDGTGLGLSIVHALASAHGWSLVVTESEDGGARFEFTGVDAV